jgi:hypothetical protein
LELVYLINNHECDSPNIQIQKLNEHGERFSSKAELYNVEKIDQRNAKRSKLAASPESKQKKIISTAKTKKLNKQEGSIQKKMYLEASYYNKQGNTIELEEQEKLVSKSKINFFKQKLRRILDQSTIVKWDFKFSMSSTN